MNNQTILVIDDESAILSLVQAMLTVNGYNAVIATSGNEAVRLLEQWPDIGIELALVDVLMPDMSGIEVAQRLRSIRAGIPIVLMSGYADERASWPDMAQHLPLISKPFTPESLLRRIRETIGTQQAASAASHSRAATE